MYVRANFCNFLGERWADCHAVDLKDLIGNIIIMHDQNAIHQHKKLTRGVSFEKKLNPLDMMQMI